MTSVASTAAQLPAISHAGEDSVFFRIPSHLVGFVQTGESRESARTKEFGMSTKRCSKPVRILTVPSRLAAKEAPYCPCCGKAMEGNGRVPIVLRQLPWGWRGQG